LIPVIGMLLFILLYITATFFYPGGSQVDKNSVGFSWANNYWCNLLNENAINGKPNPAKPIAMSAMLLLCCALSFFWWIFPRESGMANPGRRVIQISGIVAMMTACLLCTNLNHDLVTNLASSLGIIATVGTFAGLYKIRWHGLFAFGIVNLLFVVVNNFLYYNKDLITYLPVVQKISFAGFLIWVGCIDVHLYLGSTNNPGKGKTKNGSSYTGKISLLRVTIF
jgi:hypothetical protein